MQVVLFLLALGQAVSAPATHASLTGRVVADGAPVRHARVVLQPPGNTAARATPVTDPRTPPQSVRTDCSRFPRGRAAPG